MTSIFVLTCAKRAAADPWSYLRATLEQIDAEELDAPRAIVCDGAYGGPRPAGWRVVEFERPAGALKGNKLAYWHLLEEGLATGGDILALEDDLELCKNAIRRMCTFPIPADLAWVQFFSPHLFQVAETIPGLWRPPQSSHLFLQAAKFPRRTLQALIDWRSSPHWPKFNESDNALQLAAANLDLRYGAHCPDLVQHVGDTSAAQETDRLGIGRVSKVYSRRIDALALYGRDDLYR